MNLEDQTIQGTNQVNITDSLEAPILKLKVERTNGNNEVSTNDLIIFVDTNDSSNPTSKLRQYVYSLSKPLSYYNQVSDKFLLEIKPSLNDVVLEVKVERNIENNNGILSVLENTIIENLESFPICLFEGNNYIYTNYSNVSIEVIYSKNTDLNKMFLNNAIYYNHKIKNDGEFSLDDIYFKDAFTKTEDKLNLEVDNANVSCLTSKNNNFSLDEDGNLVVRTITTKSDTPVTFDNIYPIGSIYLSVNSINPSTLFGGTWEQIKDKFLLSAGDSYSLGSTGGEANHTLSVAEMPSHSHSWSQSSCTNPGNHTHVVGADKDGGAGSNRYTVHITSNNTANGQQYSPVSGAAGGHTHTISGNNTNTGSGQAHNNMPPYITVNVWKRTA